MALSEWEALRKTFKHQPEHDTKDHVFFFVLAKTDFLNILFICLRSSRSTQLYVQRGVPSTQDEEVLTDAWWVVLCLSNGRNDKIQAVIDSDVFPHLMEVPV